jgi:cell division protein FtsL
MGVMMKNRRLGRLAILVLAILLPAISLFPVYQAAVNRHLQLEIKSMEIEMQLLYEESRILAAEKAELASPDRIARIAEFVLSMKKATEENFAIIKVPERDEKERRSGS